MSDLLLLNENGLYCPQGNFYIDPWQPVEYAVLTHAHADHARRGSQHYLAIDQARGAYRVRLGEDADFRFLRYGEEIERNGVSLSLHPAGHILGSAQVRIAYQGYVAVVSGDYKLGPDDTCSPFEPLRCHLFVTESTFGLPIFRWRPQEEVFAEINAWWRSNQNAGRASLLFGYAMGKSQRLLAGLDPGLGPIYMHGALVQLMKAYRDAGVLLPPCKYVGEAPPGTKWDRALVLAPPSTHGSAWTKKFAPSSTALASGWMTIRGTRRRKAVDRGFVLSDHADWPGLLDAVRNTGAEQVWVTHGYVAVLVRYLREKGIDAVGLQTRFEGEREDASEEPDNEVV